jgi:hypothetical protein
MACLNRSDERYQIYAQQMTSSIVGDERGKRLVSLDFSR